MSELEDAVKAFHDALDAYDDRVIGHDYELGWVDDNGHAITEALLKAGWRPPGAESA